MVNNTRYLVFLSKILGNIEEKHKKKITPTSLMTMVNGLINILLVFFPMYSTMQIIILDLGFYHCIFFNYTNTSINTNVENTF